MNLELSHLVIWIDHSHELLSVRRELCLVCYKFFLGNLLHPLLPRNCDLPYQLLLDLIVNLLCIGQSVFAQAILEKRIGGRF